MKGLYESTENKGVKSRSRRKIDTTIRVMTIEEIKQERISCYQFMIS